MNRDLQVMAADDARQLTDAIKDAVTVAWELITRAYTERAWVALGYNSWDSYCLGEFGDARLRIPREERPEMVCSLRQAGMSVRAIASATGAAYNTVLKDVTQIESPNEDTLTEELINAGPPRITGLDGKTYLAQKPNRPPPQSNTSADRFYRALSQLQHHALQLELLMKKDDFPPNLVRREHHEGVLWAQEILGRVLTQMHADQSELF